MGTFVQSAQGMLTHLGRAEEVGIEDVESLLKVESEGEAEAFACRFDGFGSFTNTKGITEEWGNPQSQEVEQVARALQVASKMRWAIDLYTSGEDASQCLRQVEALNARIIRRPSFLPAHHSLECSIQLPASERYADYLHLNRSGDASRSVEFATSFMAPADKETITPEREAFFALRSLLNEMYQRHTSNYRLSLASGKRELVTNSTLDAIWDLWAGREGSVNVRVCQVCGRLYIAKTATAKKSYCSKACRNKADYLNGKQAAKLRRVRRQQSEADDGKR